MPELKWRLTPPMRCLKSDKKGDEMFLDQKMFDILLDRLEKRVEIFLAKYGVLPTENKQPETVQEVLDSLPRVQIRCPSLKPGTDMQCGMILNEKGTHDPISRQYLHGQSLTGTGWN